MLYIFMAMYLPVSRRVESSVVVLVPECPIRSHLFCALGMLAQPNDIDGCPISQSGFSSCASAIIITIVGTAILLTSSPF